MGDNRLFTITGNHALALAYHGNLLGIPVTCIMPTVAPLAKVAGCQELGARVVLHGAHILEAKLKADEFADNEVFILHRVIFPRILMKFFTK